MGFSLSGKANGLPVQEALLAHAQSPLLVSVSESLAALSLLECLLYLSTGIETFSRKAMFAFYLNFAYFMGLVEVKL